MALPPKNFCLKLPNSVRNAKRNFGGNAIGNVANQKPTTQYCNDQMIRANMHINFFLLFLTDFFWPLVVIRVVTLRIRHLSSFFTYGQFHHEIMSKRFSNGQFHHLIYVSCLFTFENVLYWIYGQFHHVIMSKCFSSLHLITFW